MASRRVLAILLVALLPFAAGCNFGDWYNQRGTVKVEVSVIGPQDSAISNFTSLKLIIFQVQIRQRDAASPETFRFSPPEIVDLVDMVKKGERRQVAEHKFNLRAIDEVLLFIEVESAVDAAGKVYRGCIQGQSVPRDDLCIRTSRSGYPHREPDFSPDRGGVVVLNMPVGVAWGATEGEYYIRNAVGEVRTE